MGKATLDKPANRETVLNQIRAQHGLEVGVWELVGIKKATYYLYKDRHPDFAELVEQIRADFKPVVLPHNDKELQQIATEKLKEYVSGGCKTKRLRRIMDATPLFNDDGTRKLDNRGQPMYTYEVKQVIEDVYDNGINLKAYEKIVPEDRMTEKTLKFYIASMVQDIQEQAMPDEDKAKLFDYLRGFKERAFLELAASK